MKQFSIKEEMDVVHVYFYGEMKLESYEPFLKQLTEKRKGQQIKLLHDHTKATPGLKVREIKQLVALFKYYLKDEEYVKIAYMSNSPLGTALAMLIKKELEDTNMNLEIFSEKKAAIKWLAASSVRSFV